MKGLATGVEVDEIRTRIGDRLNSYFPQADLRRASLQLKKVSYRDYSNIYLFDVFQKDGIELPRNIAVKVFSRDPKGQDAARQQYAALTEAWSAFENVVGLTIPRPIDLYLDLSAVVTDEVRGKPVQRLMKFYPFWPRGESRLAKINCSAGAWLRQFHEGTVTAPGYLDVRGKLEQWERQIRHLENSGFAGSVCQRLRSTLTGLAYESDRVEMPMASVHGDFTVDNVLADGDRITVVDLGGRDRNAVYHDIATYLNSLTLIGLTWPIRHLLLKELSRDFLAGYFRGARYCQPAVTFLQIIGLTSVALEILERRHYQVVVRWRLFHYMARVCEELIESARSNALAPENSVASTFNS